MGKLIGRELALSLGTIASKIIVTPKTVYLPISKTHSILAVANLLAHNSISQILKFVTAVKFHYSFSDNLTPLRVTLILQSIVFKVFCVFKKLSFVNLL